MSTILRPLSPRLLVAAAAAVLPVIFAALLLSTAAAQQPEQPDISPPRISLDIDADYIRARGGSAQVVVTIAADAAEPGDRVSLSASRGGFGSETGPNRAELPLRRNADGLLEAGIRIHGDGRAGSTSVIAQAAGLSASRRIAFSGPPASVRQVGAIPEGLLAERIHEITFELQDAEGRPVPDAEIVFRTAAGAALVNGAPRAEARTGPDGRAAARVEGAPGRVEIEAIAGSAAATAAFDLRETPADLRILSLAATVIQRGDPGEAGNLWVLLSDRNGRGVPGQRIEFAVSEGGLELASERPDGAFVTDEGGNVLARVDASRAAGGDYAVRASWNGGAALRDVVRIRVAGLPASLYLTASPLSPPSPDAPAAYSIEAAVLDGAGRPVADGYNLRWALLSAPPGAAIDSPTSPVVDGGATAVLSLGSPADRPGGVRLRAWVSEAPRVAETAVLSGLTGSGTALRRGVNQVTWIGAAAPVHEAMAAVASIGGEVWRRDPADGAWRSYQLGAGAEGSFTLMPGDRLFVRVESAAILPLVTR